MPAVAAVLVAAAAQVPSHGQRQCRCRVPFRSRFVLRWLDRGLDLELDPELDRCREARLRVDRLQWRRCHRALRWLHRLALPRAPGFRCVHPVWRLAAP